jgi:hypothetical protein
LTNILGKETSDEEHRKLIVRELEKLKSSN